MEEDYEINVDIDMAHQDALTIFINYRVLDYQGNFIGATGVGLNLYTVRKLIQKYQEKYGCHIFFVNRSGAVTLRGAGHPADSERLRDMEGISKYEEEILSSDRERFQYRRNGKTRHLNVRYIPEFEWFLLIEQAEEEAVSDILRTLLTNLVILLVITGIVLAVITRLISTYNRRQEYMATRDELTGALNRHAFDELIAGILDEYSDKNANLSALMVDLDLFKNVNDRHGHHAGDRVLKEISDRIGETIREPDLLFRWGGEEFLVLLKNCGIENALTVAEKIRNAIQSLEVEYGEQTISCTTSIGVAEFQAGESEDDLVNRADRNLYRAKEEGRNRVCGG
jgi:diguanylate cyclase (GGDEF)-like protein